MQEIQLNNGPLDGLLVSVFADDELAITSLTLGVVGLHESNERRVDEHSYEFNDFTDSDGVAHFSHNETAK